MRLSALLLAISLVGCGGQAPNLGWNPAIYAGDARTQSVVRQQGEDLEIIKASDVRFDSMICMQNDEIRKALAAYQNVIKKCKTWEL